MSGARRARVAAAVAACLGVVVVPAGAARQAAPSPKPAAPPVAVATPPPLDAVPLHYQLTVTPDFGTATFDGDLTIDFRVDRPTQRITLDAVGLDIHDADIALPDDRHVRPSVTTDAAEGTATFTVATRLYPGTIKLRIDYEGRLRSDGRGFYLVRTGGRKYLVSQLESTDARRAFPCVDNPAYKASFAVSAVIDQKLTGISNGRVISDTPAEKFGKHVLRFGTTPRMSTYLVALAVGEFGCLEATAESIPIRVCASPENKDRGAFVLEAARRALQFDSQYFTFKYPFGKLDLLAVPGGFPGAMENSGAIFFDEGWLADPDREPENAAADVAVTVSHEVAHQWLGDVVTMKWWDDLWLNEGMATWLAPKAVAAWKPAWRVEMSALADARKAMRVDALRSARPVRAGVATEAEIEESFDAIAYEKAASVLRMVETWVGPDAMRNAVNAYVRAHAYGNATGEDLWNQVATAAGKPADQVLRAFLTEPGVPLVSIRSACEGDETSITASVRRYATEGEAASAPAASWPIPLEVRGVNRTAPMLVSTPHLLTEATQTFRIAGCFSAVLADSGATGYFHTAVQPEALALLTSVASSRLTPAERVRLLDDQWALSAAGTESIGAYLSLVAALAGDTTPEVLEAIAEGLDFLRAHVVDDSSRQPFEAWVRAVFGPRVAALGRQPKAGDPAELERLRAAALDILGTAARDADTLTMARTLVVADASGAQPADRAMLPSLRRLAARTADAELLEKLRAQDPVETLASAGDASFVTQALESAMRRPSGRADLPALIAAALDNPAVNGPVWLLVKARWADIQPALDGSFALSGIVAATGSFCDAPAREDVKQFFADKTSTIRRTLQLTLDRIDACRDFRLRQGTPLTEWLTRK